MHELPLVIFTVLAQTAVGITIFASIGILLNKISQQVFTKSLWIALFTLTIGGIASIFHLGQPLRVFNVLAGVGRSPISNEIILIILFGGFLSSAAICSITGKESLTKVLAVLASIAGVALIFVIPAIYTIETVPQWDTNFTSIYMLLTVFSMGAAVVYLLSLDRMFAYVAATSLLIGMTIIPLYFTHIGLTEPSLLNQDIVFWIMKLVLASFAILSFILINSIKTKEVTFASVAVLFIVASELCGRIGFYDLWQMGM